MNSFLTVLAIDVLLTLRFVDAPSWLYTLFLVGMVLVLGLPIPDDKKAKMQQQKKMHQQKSNAEALRFQETEKRDDVPEDWDYDYSVYCYKFDVV